MLAITRLSVTKPLAVIAIFIAVAVAGLLAYTALPINLLPNANIPVVTIITTYPGAGPLEVESHVTEPLENSVASIPNLDVMTSTSSEGASTIALTFTDKANPDLIATTVERQVNAVVQSLPRRRPAAQRQQDRPLGPAGHAAGGGQRHPARHRPVHHRRPDAHARVSESRAASRRSR